jgi:RNA polymerase sigma-70 factor (ECF subfamily)
LFFSVIYQIVGEFDLAEDLVQETFLKILTSLDQYLGGNFKYWCLAIAKNLANQAIRKKIKERETLEEYATSQMMNVSPKTKSLNGLLTDIKGIVNAECYEIIVLHALENVKFKDIAKKLNQTTSQVIGKYKRGIDKLKKEIDYEKYC